MTEETIITGSTETVTPLVKMRNWLKLFPGGTLLDQFKIDYTDRIPGNSGLFPDGIVEISRTEDILGGVTVVNQLNFGLYYLLTKEPTDDAGALANAELIQQMQEWVQEQSVMHNAPVFGDEPWREKITAQNGQFYQIEETGTGTYMVQLSVQYIKRY